jgi:CRP/FNR family transcriptional regulator
MARGFVTSADGRQTTVRYVHKGELLGGMTVMQTPFEGSVQCVLDTVVTHLDIANFRNLVMSDVDLSQALASDLASRFAHAVRVIAVQAFGSVAQRLAFDLLDRACTDQQRYGKLETHASQQELADSVGSVREVVARAIGELRDLGLIETSRRLTRVIDPWGLDDYAAAAFHFAGVGRPRLGMAGAGG